MDWKVPHINLPAQFAALEPEIMAATREVLASGGFILRSAVPEFESRMAEYLGVRRVIGVNSGTDALQLALLAAGIGPGDEVVTVSHTFVATIATVAHCNATPVLVDVGEDFNIDPAEAEKALTPKTRAIVPVHMNGRCCDMEALGALAERHNLTIVEDAAQAVGSSFNGTRAGAFGKAGCFSLHPMKALGCAGDGGFISTDDDEMDRKLRLLRDHGQETKEKLAGFGFNSRLDTLQAAIVNVKFPHLEAWNERRRRIALLYEEGFKDLGEVSTPPPPEEDGKRFDTFSSYVVRAERRDDLAAHLRERGIEVFVAWSTPLHKQKGLDPPEVSLPVTERISGEVLSLPVVPETADEQVGFVIDAVREFYG